MDVDITSGEESSESFDPDHSVITSSQKNEEGSVGKDQGGVPGTQTNLPRPTTVRPASSGNGLVRRTETLAYQTNRVVRRTKMPQGILRRMSVSVIVDQDLKWDMVGKGPSAHPQRTLTPPSAERLKSIQSVVAAAAGINTQRGDLLTVETQPFESTLNAEPPVNMMPPHTPSSQPTRLSPVVIGSVGAALLLMCLGAFLFLKRQKAKAIPLQAELEEGKHEKALPAAEQAQYEENASISGAKQPAIKATEDLIALNMAPLTKSELLNRQVSEQAEKDPASLARIIRTWLNEPEQAGG
jgi:flagellar M-ring protein FliF